MWQACLSRTSASCLGSLCLRAGTLLAGGPVTDAFKFPRFMHYKPQVFCLGCGYRECSRNEWMGHLNLCVWEVAGAEPCPHGTSKCCDARAAWRVLGCIFGMTRGEVCWFCQPWGFDLQHCPLDADSEASSVPRCFPEKMCLPSPEFPASAAEQPYVCVDLWFPAMYLEIRYCCNLCAGRPWVLLGYWKGRAHSSRPSVWAFLQRLAQLAQSSLARCHFNWAACWLVQLPFTVWVLIKCFCNPSWCRIKFCIIAYALDLEAFL